MIKLQSSFIRSLVLAAGASLAVLSGATDAHAGRQIRTESFEGNPSTTWERFQGGDASAWFDIDRDFARSGRNNGWLRVKNGWAAERMKVEIGNFPYRDSCGASAFVKALGPGAQVGIELWNSNGWTKIAQSYPWIPGDGQYHAIMLGQLDLRRYGGTLYVQVIYGDQRATEQFVRIDDVSFGCSTPF